MSEPDVSFDMVHGISAGGAYDLGFDNGAKAVMHQIDSILFADTSDHEIIKEIKELVHEFWGDDAE